MPTAHTILYNWKIGGEAGYGIMNTAGPIFAKTLLRAGFFVCVYREYPSLIRGGHNTMQVAIDIKPVDAVYHSLDQLVALNTNTVIWNQEELKKNSVIIYDSVTVKFAANRALDAKRIPPLTGTYSIARAKKETRLRDDILAIGIAFEKIAEETGGSKVMRNTVAVGSALAVVEKRMAQCPPLLEIGKGVLADTLGRKGEEVLKSNQKVLEAGYNEAKSQIQT
ncbi:MAG: 2-oxoacid:acceptor oxidoreductase family protein [Candidatus Jacksonbacteria bacterium]|nr:2-oxoacid:acceptor oxidoreductase family protein [Candidatus Jacksonbacteria bacterium]